MRLTATTILALGLAALPVAAQSNKNLAHAKKATATIELSPGRDLAVSYRAIYWSASAFAALDTNERLREFYNGFLRQMLKMELVLPVRAAVGPATGPAVVELAAGTYAATFLHRGKDGWRFAVFAADGRTIAAEIPLAPVKDAALAGPFAAAWRATETVDEPAALLEWSYGPLRAAVRFAATPAPKPAPESRPAGG